MGQPLAWTPPRQVPERPLGQNQGHQRVLLVLANPSRTKMGPEVKPSELAAGNSGSVARSWWRQPPEVGRRGEKGALHSGSQGGEIVRKNEAMGGPCE